MTPAPPTTHVSSTMCSTSPTRLASTATANFSGGLGVPSAAGTHVLFPAYDQRLLQSVWELQPGHASSPLVPALSAIPAHPGHRFGGFDDLTSSSSGRFVGFVGVGNTSVPLRSRFFGAYIIDTAAEPPEMRKIADTTDTVPVAEEKRLHSLSAPAIYTVGLASAETHAAFVGSDAPIDGREFLMRWTWRSGARELLLDGSAAGLKGLSPPQLCGSEASGAAGARWLVFGAQSADRGGVPPPLGPLSRPVVRRRCP